MNQAHADQSQISCGERLVEFLEAYGVDTVFGIPGNHTVQLYRGLSRSTIRHLSPRHEQGAAFMADGYARASGRVAACFLISGPGLGNAITPMMQALADSIPMLVVTAVAERAHLAMGEGRLHELPDQRGLASQCTRFSHTLMRAEELPKVLARAFAIFDSARPGPVHIEIPLDVITSDATAVAVRPWSRVRPPAASPRGLDELALRLQSAQRPCLLLGGGAVNAAPEIKVLLERLAIPVICTVNAKGILPSGHPLLLKGSPSLGSIRDFLHDSDVVLAVGTEFGETDYDMLFQGDLGPLAWLARIDIDAAQLCRNQPADLALCGDARESLSALSSRLSVDAVDSSHAEHRVGRAQRRVTGETHFSTEMQSFFDVLQHALPNLCLVGDSTLPTYYAVWQYEAPAPRRYFHSATGGGTLGFAIPAAIGARRALGSDIPVVALIGDGAAQFTFMELAAAVQEELPIIVLLWDNHGYAEIHKGMQASGVEPVGVAIDRPDFLGAALALGCAAERVDSLQELERALAEATSVTVPTVIVVPEEKFLSGDAAGDWY